MAYTQTANTVYIPKEKVKEIDRYLNTNPLSPYEGLSDGQVICTNISFPDGYHMEIRCVGVEYVDGEDNMWDNIVNDRVFHDFSDEEIERYRTLIKNDAPMKSVILDI